MASVHGAGKNEQAGEWQCIYCGRFMDDRRAIRRVNEDGWDVYACVACHRVMPMSRSKRLKGRQKYAIQFFNLRSVPQFPGYAWYVGQDGLPALKPRK